MKLFTTAPVSPKGTLNIEDLYKTAKNELIFAAPTLLILIGTFTPLVPSTWRYATIVMWILKGATEVLQRLTSGPAVPHQPAPSVQPAAPAA